MLTEYELTRYDRQIRVFGKEGQEALKRSRVLVVGAGGLGSAVATYLAYAGVGTIILVDDGVVELSDLNRQILYTDADIGRSKAKVACERLSKINPSIKVECFCMKFVKSVGEKLVGGVDVVVDCLDNWETKLLLNDLCMNYRKPLIHAGVEGWHGQLMTIVPGKTPCLRCLVGTGGRAASLAPPTPVVGVAAGLLGILEACEVVKLVVSGGKAHVGGLLIVDLLSSTFELVELRKNPRCQVCASLK